MPYNFAAESFHIKKLCSRLSSKDVQFYTENGYFAFLSPPLGGLEETYAVHLRLIGKLLVDFLLVIIEHFSLRATAETLQANISWKLPVLKVVGQFGPKFQVEGDVLTNRTSCRKLRYENVGRSFFHFVTIHAFGRRTDRQMDCSLQDCSCIAAVH